MDNLPSTTGEYRKDYNLSQLTWFKVGGNAKLFFKPNDMDDLTHVISNISHKTPIFVLGAGSNIIIRDGGFDGVVIKLGRNFTSIIFDRENRLLKVGAGALNYSVAQFALNNNISGFEFLIGIPGTIGGGIAMNAGSYGSEFKDIVESITILDRNGKSTILSNEQIGFAYRKNSLKDWYIVTEVSFKTMQGDPLSIKTKMDEITTKRQTSQPVNSKTGGSTFANPDPQISDGKKAWELIDSVGMRGFKIGGAEISPMHCNFLINNEHAKASDLESLGEMAREKVKESYGVDLKWEIKIIGKK
jgi:UDP-N-acetylmuramate dehydrogenase